ncbi:MAG: hypothetical protein A2252_09175 [Elusimicrobia bacterium RIFOXYA2_FULL_39_19]|nr:MAG: hypothetical protein A2252_09175 [Elusimicrobia bacterium RIFOXYA2_FULL_39_19]
MFSVYRLSLKSDKKVNGFKRLNFTKVEVPLSKLLKEGIHPAYSFGSYKCLRDKLTDAINQEKFIPPELKQLDYTREFSSGVNDYTENDKLKLFLEEIKAVIYFIDSDIRFPDLLEIAKEQLKKDWTHYSVKEILKACYHDFNELRTFVKSKDPEVKMVGYESLDNMHLDKILKIEDFSAFEKMLILYGFETHNFRYADYLKSITTAEGFLSLKPEITEFQLKYPASKEKPIIYNCKLTGDVVKCYPELDEFSEKKRQIAKEFSRLYAVNNEKYCPAVPLSKIEELQEQKIAYIYFGSLSYREEADELPTKSEAGLKKESVRFYKIDKFLTESASNKKLQEILKYFDEKISGRKEEIVERYTDIAVQEYNKSLPKLDKYFADRKFIKVSIDSRDEDGQEFEVLKDNPIKNLLLSMYFIKHLRGNIVFDTGYENDTYLVKELAKALIDRKVFLDGGFVEA